MENKEQKNIAHELGTIYGASISKNGKWLNVKVMTSHNGETISVNACVPIFEDEPRKTDKKAYNVATYTLDGNDYTQIYVKYLNTPKPKEEEPTADDLPF